MEAPYFVDMVNDTLQNQFQDANFQSNAFRIYTSLDMRLQRVGAEAIRKGMAMVDDQIRKQKRFRGQTLPKPQVALVAIDPHTGEVKALLGGRNYGLSQLDHVLRDRQPGSIFKPFVYAAAMDTGVEGGPQVLTPSSHRGGPAHHFYLDGNREYTPSNFKHEYYGPVPLRDALAHSLNVATVKVAEQVGYDAVVDMANRAGMNYKIQPTPAVALGSYDITPLEAAGAYTIFANHGRYVKPRFITLVRSQDGKVHVQEQGRAQAGARSARGVSDDQPAGRSAAQRHRRGGTREVQIQRSGGRKDRHVARRMVRRLHLGIVVHRMGGF